MPVEVVFDAAVNKDFAKLRTDEKHFLPVIQIIKQRNAVSVIGNRGVGNIYPAEGIGNQRVRRAAGLAGIAVIAQLPFLVAAHKVIQSVAVEVDHLRSAEIADVDLLKGRISRFKIGRLPRRGFIFQKDKFPL